MKYRVDVIDLFKFAAYTAAVAMFLLYFVSCSGLHYGPQPPTTLEEIHHEQIVPEENFIWGAPPSPTPKPSPDHEDGTTPLYRPKFNIKIPS